MQALIRLLATRQDLREHVLVFLNLLFFDLLHHMVLYVCQTGPFNVVHTVLATPITILTSRQLPALASSLPRVREYSWRFGLLSGIG